MSKHGWHGGTDEEGNLVCLQSHGYNICQDDYLIDYMHMIEVFHCWSSATNTDT